MNFCEDWWTFHTVEFLIFNRIIIEIHSQGIHVYDYNCTDFLQSFMQKYRLTKSFCSLEHRSKASHSCPADDQKYEVIIPR